MNYSKSKLLISNSNQDNHLYWLDWMRFSASLLVVAGHARGGLWVDWGRLAIESKTVFVAIFFAISRAGAESVLVFFVLSGFLVGGKVIERLANNTFDIRVYVIDRFTRIWIPLIPALIFSAVVAYQVGKPVSWLDFFGNLAGLQGTLVKSFAENHPLWSLSYEIWFYFLAASLSIWLISNEKIRILAGFALAVGLTIFTKLVIVFLFAWVLGASTYWLVKKKKNNKLALIGLSLIIIGYVTTQLRSATVSVDKSIWLQYIPSAEVGTLAFSFGIALVIPFLTKLAPESGIGKRLNAMGGQLAAFSYTLYLIHYPILYLWEYFMPGRHSVVGLETIAWYALRVISCMAVSWLFYLPFEKQTTRARNWLLNIWPAQKPRVVIDR